MLNPARVAGFYFLWQYLKGRHHPGKQTPNSLSAIMRALNQKKVLHLWKHKPYKITPFKEPSPQTI